MAGDQTTVDIDGMRAAQPHFEQALSETSTAFQSMEDQRMTLASSWQGDAAMGFAQALDAWLQNCNVVKQQLSIVTEKLAQNTGGYTQVHQNTQDAATVLRNAVSGGLPGF